MFNIYTYKNYKLYIIVPLILLLISLFFIPKIILDTSLTGGTTVQFSTANSINVKSLTSSIDALIPGTTVTVSKIGGLNHISLIALPNKSITSGQAELLNLTSLYSNYSSYSADIAIIRGNLTASPGNVTDENQLVNYTGKLSSTISSMDSTLDLELHYFSPFITPSSYIFNSTNATSMIDIGRNADSNASSAYQSGLIAKIRSVIPFSTYSYDSVTPTLGAYFLSKVIDIIIAAFIIVAIVVFIIFRTPIPSFAIVFGAANDMIIALGAMGLFHIELGVASVGGLLMLIGYAIDTEVLSSVRVLKRTDGTNEERAFQSMKTGLTMTGAAIITFGILFIVSYIAFVPTYIEISGVVLFGLIGDIFTAWLGNTAMVLWYKNKRDSRWQR
ncbi:preprotein translocase subunit SecF [Candidatus Mancarchaeum acidiphilum]|uniref:Protein-export membrane protein SecF n=1 Tax=Candidatus Mancarchaeum acidiphilum TaxID=1920749 RepID=A0A218NLY2_9ARCH|nr:hypothetical protein [Candidatus Mancarchaeum acidiphilum]ASI13462.1 preprotein translocase subunit SecF [Candidatus Mancarchaeum acidiphilum]